MCRIYIVYDVCVCVVCCVQFQDCVVVVQRRFPSTYVTNSRMEGLLWTLNWNGWGLTQSWLILRIGLKRLRKTTKTWIRKPDMWDKIQTQTSRIRSRRASHSTMTLFHVSLFCDASSTAWVKWRQMYRWLCWGTGKDVEALCYVLRSCYLAGMTWRDVGNYGNRQSGMRPFGLRIDPRISRIRSKSVEHSIYMTKWFIDWNSRDW